MSTGKNAGKLDPRQDPLSIGNLAIQKGYATQEQVQSAVKKQEARLPIGEILIEDGVLTSAQLEELLIEQEVLRSHLDDKAAGNFIRKRRQEKIKEVTKSLRAVATSLLFAVKD